MENRSVIERQKEIIRQIRKSDKKWTIIRLAIIFICAILGFIFAYSGWINVVFGIATSTIVFIVFLINYKIKIQRKEIAAMKILEKLILNQIKRQEILNKKLEKIYGK